MVVHDQDEQKKRRDGGGQFDEPTKNAAFVLVTHREKDLVFDDHQSNA